jgi:2-methylisocitrate lyase-like PEP mutase family enzyme
LDTKERKSFRALHEAGGPIVMPAAHDALSARLIARAGFRALAISGSAMLASRYVLPDLGIAGLADMVAGVGDVMRGSNLPCLSDGDDGYGDAKSVARTVLENERLGVGALVLEDQTRSLKAPGQSPSIALVSTAEMETKIRVATQTRSSSDFWIVARTDAYSLLGLDAAIGRAEAYSKAGADALFVTGVRREEDLASIGKTFKGIPLSIVMQGGEGWPWLAPSELYAMGFTMISYPRALILPTCLQIHGILRDLREAELSGGAPPAPQSDVQARSILAEAVDEAKWRALGV